MDGTLANVDSKPVYVSDGCVASRLKRFHNKIQKVFHYMQISHRSLIIIAGIVWYGGGISLLLKGWVLIKHAYLIDAQSNWAFIAAVVGVIAGLLKGMSIFNKSCKKNIKRIHALPNPRIWQCLRPGMLIFLAIIIPAAAWMSRAAIENYTLLCLVGGLDLSISIALLTSSLVFWKLKAFSPKN